MLGLYLKYLVDITGNRANEGGSKVKTFITQLTIESFKGSWEYLSTEFPSLLYGRIMANLNTKNCTENMKMMLKDAEDWQTTLFCADNLLNFVSNESNAFWVKLYMTRDPKLINYVVDTTQVTKDQVMSIIRPDWYVEKNLFKAMPKIK
jgi:hypothetical protein